jgi:CheY-like chemotaxis protein
VPLRVLIVDDVPDMRRLLRTALRFRGSFDVVAEAADGRTAVTMAAQSRPDLVVLDLGLPDLAGREVLTQLRDAVPEAKVVVFTGADAWGYDDVRERADGYVLKDADLDYLVDLLEDLGRSAERSVTLELGHDPRAAALARRFVEQQCVHWRCDELIESASLVVSELVANAVTHAQSGCAVRLSRLSAALRVEVEDQGVGTPDPFAASVEDEHGRGLVLVTAVATAWGVAAGAPGRKVVWAELSLPGPHGTRRQHE